MKAGYELGSGPKRRDRKPSGDGLQVLSSGLLVWVCCRHRVGVLRAVATIIWNSAILGLDSSI